MSVGFANNAPLVGSPAIGNFFIPDTTQRTALGIIQSAVDSYWGGGEFIYLQYGATIVKGAAVVWDANFVATLLPNTANQGCPVAFAMGANGVDLTGVTTGNFGWFQLSGKIPMWSSATVAAAALTGVVAAGQMGAVSAGKQLASARIVLPATTTVTKAGCSGLAALFTVKCPPGTDGIFPGLAVTGTGIGASAKVVAMSPDGVTLTLSVANSAAVSGTLTFTYNDGTNYFNVAQVWEGAMEGQIT